MDEQYTVDSRERDWRADASCAQTDPEAFFPEKGGSTREARAVCARCPVTGQCLEWALAHDERFGIWGGASVTERQAMRRARRLASSEGSASFASPTETVPSELGDDTVFSAYLRHFWQRKHAADAAAGPDVVHVSVFVCGTGELTMTMDRPALHGLIDRLTLVRDEWGSR
jgi:WhiB family redox-sensing transcriptional regulator